jgi:hypothetical protein
MTTQICPFSKEVLTPDTSNSPNKSNLESALDRHRKGSALHSLEQNIPVKNAQFWQGWSSAFSVFHLKMMVYLPQIRAATLIAI